MAVRTADSSLTGTEDEGGAALGIGWEERQTGRALVLTAPWQGQAGAPCNEHESSGDSTDQTG